MLHILQLQMLHMWQYLYPIKQHNSITHRHPKKNPFRIFCKNYNIKIGLYYGDYIRESLNQFYYYTNNEKMLETDNIFMEY